MLKQFVIFTKHVQFIFTASSIVANALISMYEPFLRFTNDLSTDNNTYLPFFGFNGSDKKYNTGQNM